MGSYLSRDAILGADDLATEDVDLSDIPGWRGVVRVRALTGSERDAYEASMRLQRGKEFIANMLNIRAKLAVRAIIDPETGERLFTDNDAPALGEKSAAALDRIFEVAARLSRISDEDVEELGKASDETPPGDSISA